MFYVFRKISKVRHAFLPPFSTFPHFPLLFPEICANRREFNTEVDFHPLHRRLFRSYREMSAEHHQQTLINYLTDYICVELWAAARKTAATLIKMRTHADGMFQVGMGFE